MTSITIITATWLYLTMTTTSHEEKATVTDAARKAAVPSRLLQWTTIAGSGAAGTATGRYSQQ